LARRANKFWVEYANKDARKEGLRLIKKLGGKVEAEYPHLNYIYVSFKNGLMEEKGVFRTLKRSRLFRAVKQDEEMFLFDT
jgi:hypothetical protein